MNDGWAEKPVLRARIAFEETTQFAEGASVKPTAKLKPAAVFHHGV